jgi:hypothetical protein
VALADQQANTLGALGQWAALDAGQQDAWDAAAAALSPAISGWTPTTAPGATPPTFTAGQLFFVWRYLLFILRAAPAPPGAAPPAYS